MTKLLTRAKLIELKSAKFVLSKLWKTSGYVPKSPRELTHKAKIYIGLN